MMHLGFRTHINPAGRLVNDQHLGLFRQPLRNDHFLLIAAAQRRDRRVDTRAANSHIGSDSPRLRGLITRTEIAVPSHAAETCERHILSDRQGSDETRGLINANTLARMKPTSILVNIARGPVVDTQALYEALVAKRIAAAGLDVTDPEPLPRNHPLLGLGNVVIAPHLGSATIETRRRMAEISVDNLRLGLAGKPLLHEVRT